MPKQINITIDANEANVNNRVGSNVYAFELLKHLELITKIKKNFNITVLLSHNPVRDFPSARKNWNYKIFYNEDIRANVLNSETFKTFSSGADLFFTHKDGEAIETQIEGKPVMIITTAKGVSSDELTRRYVNCGLNDSINQTQEIMKR